MAIGMRSFAYAQDDESYAALTSRSALSARTVWCSAFGSDLIRLRTREGRAIARAKGKLRGKSAKLSDKQQLELRRMHKTGYYFISDLADVFSVSRPTVHRTINRQLVAKY
jgi:DNA invertase Pin-like site-specific DNA recombinase